MQSLLEDILAGRFPDARGRYGPFGGRYVPETLVAPLERLQAAASEYLQDPQFLERYRRELQSWAGRPTALTEARGLGARWGASVWLKREDLAHTGAHKINNALGQVLLAERLGARRVIAETGAGQHGVATAAACARVGLPCTIYMGALDMERQSPNVGRMRLMGATVVAVESGDRTLRAAVDEALRDWVSDPDGTYYCLGSAIGPHPYPFIVRELQSVIGREARQQLLDAIQRLPDAAVGLCRRRLECDRPLPSVHPRCRRGIARIRSGRKRRRPRRERGFHCPWPSRRAARLPFAPAPG